MSTIGMRLRSLRAQTKLTQRALGKLAGLRSPAHVSLIENEKRTRIAGETASVLAKALGCSVRYLLEGVGQPPSKKRINSAVKRAAAEGDADAA